MSKLESRAHGLQGILAQALDRHFVACAAAAAAAAVATQARTAQAAIVYSGLQNINVPNSMAGIYVNLVTKTTGSSKSTLADWDINPYVSASSGRFRIYDNSTTKFVDGGSAAGEDTAARLAGGDPIGSSQTYTFESSPLLATPDGQGPWAAASSGDFLGIQFTEATVHGGNPVFGWIRMTKGENTPATGEPSGINIVDWAYDDSGAQIAAGAGVPEPSSLALLAAGAVGLMARRGRVQLRRAE
jgi:hypothetical protein